MKAEAMEREAKSALTFSRDALSKVVTTMQAARTAREAAEVALTATRTMSNNTMETLIQAVKHTVEKIAKLCDAASDAVRLQKAADMTTQTATAHMVTVLKLATKTFSFPKSPKYTKHGLKTKVENAFSASRRATTEQSTAFMKVANLFTYASCALHSAQNAEEAVNCVAEALAADDANRTAISKLGAKSFVMRSVDVLRETETAALRVVEVVEYAWNESAKFQFEALEALVALRKAGTARADFSSFGGNRLILSQFTASFGVLYTVVAFTLVIAG